jgi:nicotinamidase-related amidase
VSASAVKLGAGDALIVADVQKDFLPGGSLAVLQGDQVVPVLNRYLAAFDRLGLPIFISRCWHPPDHCSFRERGGPWPRHCVAGSPGAEFAGGFEVPGAAVIVSKATLRDRDAYSVFEGTELHDHLRRVAARRLFVGGLTTDYCVLNTVRDACARGYPTFVLGDGIRPVNVQPDDGRKAEEEMARRGATFVRFESLAT